MKYRQRKLFKVLLSALLCLVMVFPAVMGASAATTLSAASDDAYTWLKAQQDLTIGAAGDGMVDSFDDWWDASNRVQVAYTYDQGVAAIAFMLKGDRVRAEKLLSKMADFQDPNGSWINSYWWNNGAGEEIRQHVGVIAWMAMAYMTYEKKYADTRYRPTVKKALDWCIAFQKGNGGISGGKTQWDAPPAWTDEVWTSTEHNEDMYNLLKYYANVFSDRTTAYNNAAAGVKSFLDNVVWNDTLKRWSGGWKNNTNLLDPSIPMDVNPWGVLSLGLSGVRDYKQSLAFIDNANGAGTLTDPKYVQTLDYDGQGHMMTAYDFDWQYDCAPAQTQTGQPNGNRCADIWLEGSAFMSLAHFMNGNTSKADSILNEMIKKQGTSGTLLGGMPYSLKGSNNNYWKMKQENCVSSTGWLIIAIARYNPFTAEYLTGSSLSIGSINPTSGPVGSAVTISGSGFGATQGTSTLKFGTTAATITNWSNTSINTVVPSGLAAGSYQVAANVNGAASNSQAFTVTSASITPSVSSLSPLSGAAGSSVTITGTNFGSTQGASTVKFGAIAAAVTSWSSTSIQATVPSGLAAGSYNVVVTVNGTASNSQAFSVTSSGGAVVSTLYVNTGGVLSATAGTGAATNTIASAGGTNHDGTPTNATTYLIAGLNGTYDPSKATGFNLFVDAGANVGDGLQVQVQYDFTGDGTWDRTETYNYFATNPVVDWENYTQGQGLKSSAGSFANLVNGKVRINVWNAIGSTATTLRTNASSANGQQSVVTIPYN